MHTAFVAAILVVVVVVVKLNQVKRWSKKMNRNWTTAVFVAAAVYWII